MSIDIGDTEDDFNFTVTGSGTDSSDSGGDSGDGDDDGGTTPDTTNPTVTDMSIW